MGWGVHDYPSPPETATPICPECGEECEKIYRSVNGEVIGCENCIREQDAWEYLEETKERDDEYD